MGVTGWGASDAVDAVAVVGTNGAVASSFVRVGGAGGAGVGVNPAALLGICADVGVNAAGVDVDVVVGVVVDVGVVDVEGGLISVGCRESKTMGATRCVSSKAGNVAGKVCSSGTDSETAVLRPNTGLMEKMGEEAVMIGVSGAGATGCRSGTGSAC